MRKLLVIGMVAVCGLALLALSRARGAVSFEADIVYATVEGVPLRLDLARPVGGGPYPLVICLHGGARQAGSRADVRSAVRRLAEHGYVAAAVEYRLTPRWKFPAQIDDVRAALAFLRSNAALYSIDPQRVAALGESAGGHLALLLGLMDGPAAGAGSTATPAASSNRVEPARLRAVVNFYAPTDLRSRRPRPAAEPLLQKSFEGRDSNALPADFAGTSDRGEPVMARISPVTYVDSCDPPVLTLHGAADLLVPVEQARRLHEALRKAGVIEALEIVDAGGHGFSGRQRERLDRIVTEFLDRHLKAAEVAGRN
jgi:acetyl esterase/lipase